MDATSIRSGRLSFPQIFSNTRTSYDCQLHLVVKMPYIFLKYLKSDIYCPPHKYLVITYNVPFDLLENLTTQG